MEKFIAHVIAANAAGAGASIIARGETHPGLRGVLQDGTTVTIACYTLRRMAYLAPQTVLPLVCQRFEVCHIQSQARRSFGPSNPRLSHGVPGADMLHGLGDLASTCVRNAAAVQAALEAVTASQQLVPAILALSMVTRPLLAFGLPPPEGEAMELDTAADAAAVKAEARVSRPHSRLPTFATVVRCSTRLCPPLTSGRF